MPHIHLEYSANCKPALPFPALFENIHATLTSHGGIRLANLKSRATCHDEFYIAAGAKQEAFVHLSIRFVEGRDKNVKRAIGEACVNHLKKHFAEYLESTTLQITVEVRDIILENYHKYPEGTLTQQSK